MQKDTYNSNRYWPHEITDKQVMEYAAIYMKETGEGISSEEARVQIRRLLTLVKIMMEFYENEAREGRLFPGRDRGSAISKG